MLKSKPATTFIHLLNKIIALRQSRSYLVVSFVSCTFGMLLLASPVLAERMESNSYVIQFSNFNSTSGTKTSTSYNLTDTVGQMASGPYGTYGSTTFVGSGFQYIYQIQDFSFSVSSRLVDFGVLSAGSFSTGSHTLTITTRGGGGYTVYAFAHKPLTHQDGSNTIPNTSCDTTCTISSAGLWANPTNAGFGFNMSGDDVPIDFVNTNYFRPFANAAAGERMQAVMTSSAIANNNQSTVTYKVAIPGSQAAGNYKTAVVYVAVPGY